jgi:hypothetical protein
MFFNIEVDIATTLTPGKTQPANDSMTINDKLISDNCSYQPYLRADRGI